MFKMFKTARSASKKKFTCSLTNRTITITTTVTQRQQQQKKHNNITQLQLSAGRLSGFYTNALSVYAYMYIYLHLCVCYARVLVHMTL